ncbi:MAG: hypothetical protein AAGE96_21755 [Cyanobacteria bacterium P01_G01_bin.19]
MEIKIERRANIALRSLQQNEQRQIAKALEKIESAQFEDLYKDYNFKKLENILDKDLYTYRGNPQLRLILSIENNVCIVEDIIAPDKLDRLVSNLSNK